MSNNHFIQQSTVLPLTVHNPYLNICVFYVHFQCKLQVSVSVLIMLLLLLDLKWTQWVILHTVGCRKIFVIFLHPHQ